jgi:hypothetical protein
MSLLSAAQPAEHLATAGPSAAAPVVIDKLTMYMGS